ncbi:MAG: hypothetical protein ACE5IQ_13235 [Candidatus Methylomirabilales bacterium]
MKIRVRQFAGRTRRGDHFRRGAGSILLVTALSIGAGGRSAGASGEAVRIPDYAGWRLEETATTYRPGTDLQFYALELKSYSNPARPADKVVELRRHDVLYIVYAFTFGNDGPHWDIYMDAGFADAPCGFLDPSGEPTGRYVRIALTCLRDTERVDLRAPR